MVDISLQSLQKDVDEWITTTGVRYFSPLTQLAQLTEEVGEVARIISRTYGEQSFKKSDSGHSLSEELGDVLFVITCLANQTGIDLTEAYKHNRDKRMTRDIDRHKQNEKLTQ